jgi:tetratricopeptide (TPR) repeat protein
MTMDEVRQAVRQVAWKVWAIVCGPVLHDAARHVNARPALVREPDVRIRLVIAQQNIEARFVLLDEIVFKRQRLFVVIDLDEVKITRFSDQAPCFGFCQPVFVEVAPYAAPKILRLANVQNGAFAIFIKVNAGLGGKLRYFLTKFHGSYNLIVTRALLAACLFAFSPTIGLSQQSQPAPVPPNSSQTAQTPDEENPPEEDESVAPEKFVLNPLESERNIKVGNYYWHRGKYRAAASRYERATRFNPNSPEAFYKLGEAEEKLKNKEAARLAFQKVMQIAPDSKLANEAKKKINSKS